MRNPALQTLLGLAASVGAVIAEAVGSTVISPVLAGVAIAEIAEGVSALVSEASHDGRLDDLGQHRDR